MPIGRLISRVVGTVGNAISNPLGFASDIISGGPQRRARARRNRAAASAEAPSISMAVPGQVQNNPGLQLAAVSSPEGSTVPVPVPTPQRIDTFDNTGTAVGSAVGSLIGGGVLGAPGAGVGAAVGSSVGNFIGNRIPVPGQGSATVQPMGDNPSQILALLGSGGRSNRRLLANYLLSSGALVQAGIVRPPLVFQGPNGAVKYGSDLGFVLITRTVNGRMVKFQCNRDFARTLGWWRPRKKPVLSVRDSNAIRRSNTAKKRVKKLAADAGYKCTDRCAPRRAPAARTNSRSRR